jgi:two-component system, OmpR family, alkaline phosphatase synthesis response regulator PhoP
MSSRAERSGVEGSRGSYLKGSATAFLDFARGDRKTAGTTDAWQKFVAARLRKKILLIDHEPRLTGAVRRALENRYSIHEEHDTAFALQVARWFHPDLILVDQAATSHDGETLLQQLQQDGELRNTPLLCLSSFVSEGDLLFAGTVSGYAFRASPVGIDHLLRGIEQLIFGR